MPHSDGNAYFPQVATISLGEGCFLDLYSVNKIKNGNDADSATNLSAITTMQPAYSVYLPPRSLLVLTGLNYTDYLHGIIDYETYKVHENVVNLHEELKIGDVMRRENTRVSLTFRCVKRVAKIDLLKKLTGKR